MLKRERLMTDYVVFHNQNGEIEVVPESSLFLQPNDLVDVITILLSSRTHADAQGEWFRAQASTEEEAIGQALAWDNGRFARVLGRVSLKDAARVPVVPTLPKGSHLFDTLVPKGA
jgi:hypothetical protein